MHLPPHATGMSVVFFILGSLGLTEATQDSEEPMDNELDIGKRLYDFGLGKRAYRYVNEYKRLPMYDFGLGKRSKMYGFGLGKRSENEESYDNYDESVPEIDVYDDDEMQLAEKRAQKMYSFGLGKRPLYGFGLGKRAPKQYSFGLGKRERLYSFGLGKRAKNSMYSFGLGKREVDQAELQEEVENSENATAALDSHEEMGHGSTKSLTKRSPRQYSFGLGKREFDEPEPFSRQYRKPAAYSFGLGKRQKNLYAFGLGKRSAPA